MKTKGACVGMPVWGTVWLVVVVASLAIWVGSMWGHGIGIIGLGPATSLQIQRGVIEVEHTYAFRFAPGVKESDWYAACAANSWYLPKWDGAFPGYAFHDGLVKGEGSMHGGLIWPNKYWMLRLPLWPLVVIPGVVAGWLFRRWYGRRRVERRGFEVVVGPEREGRSRETQ